MQVQVLRLFLVIFCFMIGQISCAADNSKNISTNIGHPPIARLYKVYYGGIHIADLAAEFSDQHVATIIKTYGLVKKVSKFSSQTIGYYRPQNKDYLPASFSTEFFQRRGKRTIDLDFSPKGEITSENVVPPDPEWKRPKVDASLKKGTYDPMTSFVVARHRIRQALAIGNKTFKFPMYDGRRLAELQFTVFGRETRTIDKIKYPVVKVQLRRVPLAGYTDNERKRIKAGEEPLVTGYFSDDELFVPILVIADAPLGSAVIRFDRSCKTLADCGLGKIQLK